MPPPTRACRYCVAGCVDSYEINDKGQCIACLDTKIETVVACDGCSELTDSCGPLGHYLVTFHDGGSGDPYYCVDCADLARMDWNGETKSIERIL